MNNLIKFLVFLDLLVVNLLVGYLIYNYLIASKSLIDPIISGNPVVEEDDQLGQIRSQYGDLVNRVANLELTPYPTAMVLPTAGATKTTTVIIPTTAVTKNISYVDIPGSGETNNLGWVDIAGTDFYFDKADYPGLLSVVMEGNIRLFNGNGIGYVRLFDVTHGIAVVGSEVNTTSQADTLVSSGLLNMWSGKNLYRIQGKSNSSDKMIYSWGRLKITTQK